MVEAVADESAAETSEKEIAKVDPRTVAVTLSPLLDDSDAIAKAYRVRKPKTVSKTFHLADAAEAMAAGWTITKRRKRSVVAQRPKAVSVQLEDRFWCLCSEMGYSVLNGDHFKVTFRRDDGSEGTKQIDVFAKDGETVLIAECKTRQVRGRRSLQKDLHETAFLQRPIANAVRAHFGNKFNPKIVWIYVTENILWSEPDVERASAANIKIITENELQYFLAYISHVGTAGRYQFLAEFLDGQDIPGLSGVKVPAVKGRLGGETFYSFTISAEHLLKIAFVNHHALNNPDGRPAYQRMIDKKRLVSIGKFIKSGGYFPTNVLVNITQNCIFEPIEKQAQQDGLKFGYLTLPNKYKSAWIIDGQHRLFGFTNIAEEFSKNPLFVVAFDRIDTLKEADLFITINNKQKSVAPGLLAALQADLQMGSSDPDEALGALASFLIRRLSTDQTSPLYGRFEIPGMSATHLQTLTVPEIQKGLKRSQLLGRVVKKVRLGGYLSGATDDATLDRARRTINAYFRELESAIPERWLAGRSAHVVTNPGIRAHLAMFAEVLRYQHGLQQIDPFLATPEELASSAAEFCRPLFEWLKNATEAEVADRFARRYGEGGVREYLFHLTDIVATARPGFGSEEFREQKARSVDERIAQAKLDVDDLTQLISRVVIEKLKDIYGTDELPSGEKKFWELGISDVDIKSATYKAQQQVKVDKRAPKEAYLTILQYRNIIRQKGNWEYLKPIFDIPRPGENPKGKEYHLDWMETFNEIRNTASHSSDYRGFAVEDFVFLTWIKSELYGRCELAGLVLE